MVAFSRAGVLCRRLNMSWNFYLVRTVNSHYSLSVKTYRFEEQKWSLASRISASEMTYIVSSGALNSTHSLTRKSQRNR